MKKVEMPVPVPKEGEILVKVEAVSINPFDWKIQVGSMKPSLPKFPCVPRKIYFFSKNILDV
jgi:chloroplastic oxoene reductase